MLAALFRVRYRQSKGLPCRKVWVGAMTYNKLYPGDKMEFGKVYVFPSDYALCHAFAEDVVQNYRQNLVAFEQKATYDAFDYYRWLHLVGGKEKAIGERVFDRLSEIIRDPSDKRYAIKTLFGCKSRRFICITARSGFFKGIIPELQDGMDGLVSVNVEYIIDRNKRTLVKRYFS